MAEFHSWLKRHHATSPGIWLRFFKKVDGRWDQAYDSPKNAVVPDDLGEVLKKNTAAQAFFKTLNKTNIYAIIWRLQTAKKT